ncbi:Ankyrin repeat-containing domain protein [Cordyceps fumosorosea ARSEF 2679]|uniref:Ankyrin repeat-containing domain protein n=1 Tax=Cordyceps fumosorosea (strain ARSEF 2679) TaxID=1081104 RepID=A0A162JPG2_CORFA|nr:Ankyrin repeat-containing domain protein [Cordyceps fumosorosea ARSEF 2679]OAA45083.1 Ankyrin repeat-containing domain protein [Cordyceps fumosorosea ARSEF 2679]
MHSRFLHKGPASRRYLSSYQGRRSRNRAIAPFPSQHSTRTHMMAVECTARSAQKKKPEPRVRYSTSTPTHIYWNLYQHPSALEIAPIPSTEWLQPQENSKLCGSLAPLSRGSRNDDSKNRGQSLSDLPPELLLHLARLLPIADSYSLAQTCKHIEGVLHTYIFQHQGERLLHWAASSGRPALAQKALKYKQNININFILQNRTPLAKAIESCKLHDQPDGDFVGVAKTLLGRKDIDLTNETNGIPILPTAIANGVYPVVHRFLEKGIQINAFLENGMTPLMVAAQTGQKNMVDFLLRRGADMNQQSTTSHITHSSSRTVLAQVLSLVAFPWKRLDGDFAAVARLLVEQQDIDLTDETNGIPMLERAISNGFYPAVDRLLKKQPADYVNAVFSNGQTPLTTAARHGHKDIVDLLLRSGANVNQRTGAGTGLHDSVYYSSLSKGGVRGDCWTALTMAARCGHDEIVSRLLECEAIDTDVISTETDTTMPVSSPGSLLGMLKQEWYYEWQNNTSQKQGHALFWAVVQGRARCVLALLQSDRVSVSADELTRLQRVAKSVQLGVGGACFIVWMLRECKDANGASSRRARLRDATTVERVLAQRQGKEIGRCQTGRTRPHPDT